MNERTIKDSYDRIPLPFGAETRIMEKIDASLPKPMRETRVVLQPKRELWRPVLTAAAALALILSVALGLYEMRQNVQTPSVVAAEPGETVEIGPPETKQPFYPGEAYYLEKYARVLDNYRFALTEEADAEVCRSLGVSTFCLRFYEREPLRRIGYCLEDLNGDRVPELLIGCTEDEGPYSNVIIALYKLAGSNGPVKLMESMADESYEETVYDCGDRLFRLEIHWNGMDSWLLYDVSFSKCVMAELTISTVRDQVYYLVPAVPPENGIMKSPEMVEVSMTREEADDWLAQYCTTSVAHRYTPFDLT